MGLFGKTRVEKQQELQQKLDESIQNLIRIGVEAITNFEFSDEQRTSLIEELEDSLIENSVNFLSNQKTIIALAILKFKEEYPDLREQLSSFESEMVDYVEDVGSIDMDGFNELIFDIDWKYNTTPEDAEQLLKNARKNGTFLSPESYKMVMAKIAEKWESELLAELDSIKSENIDEWLEETKDLGKVISTKVYAKAKTIKRGEKWLTDDEYKQKDMD